MYPPTTSESSAGDSSSESSAGPSRKRCRFPAATVTTRALVPSSSDLLPPRKRFRDSISPKDSVEEGLQDIYDHVIEIPLQRIEDIETGQRELEARSLIAGGERASLLEQVVSLERRNAKLQGTMIMERTRDDRFRRRVRFIESELRQIRKFRYYDRIRFRRLETFVARR
ncbi:hypothetical protein Tco_1209090 [Tanacetum coccineum]